MATAERKVVLVTRRTRLEDLVARFHTPAGARFYVEHLGADFAEYQDEHDTYAAARRQVGEALRAHGRHQVIDRAFLPGFLFAPDDLVVALGQDGLVANTLKYLDGQPLVGVNPDPGRNDGVLLPFEPREVAALLPDLLADRRDQRAVTMARATLSDHQVLHAVNDLFIGPRTHTSARYELQLGDVREVQSSSGLIVATGLGSTGWMTSVITGALGVARSTGAAWRRDADPLAEMRLPWDAPRLRFAVREPFPSRHSQAGLVYGDITAAAPLRLVSLMPEGGVIFSDGIENDFLAFGAGTTATIEVAAKQGRLVV